MMHLHLPPSPAALVAEMDNQLNQLNSMYNFVNDTNYEEEILIEIAPPEYASQHSICSKIADRIIYIIPRYMKNWGNEETLDMDLFIDNLPDDPNELLKQLMRLQKSAPYILQDLQQNLGDVPSHLELLAILTHESVHIWKNHIGGHPNDEYEADAGAIAEGRTPGLRRSLKRDLLLEVLEFMNQGGSLNRFVSQPSVSHPSSADRLKRTF